MGTRAGFLGIVCRRSTVFHVSAATAATRQLLEIKGKTVISVFDVSCNRLGLPGGFSSPAVKGWLRSFRMVFCQWESTEIATKEAFSPRRRIATIQREGVWTLYSPRFRSNRHY
ncbi:MAG: hypothetical protein WBA18_05240 [Terracidiphilus sp.]